MDLIILGFACQFFHNRCCNSIILLVVAVASMLLISVEDVVESCDSFNVKLLPGCVDYVCYEAERTKDCQNKGLPKIVIRILL